MTAVLTLSLKSNYSGLHSHWLSLGFSEQLSLRQTVSCGWMCSSHHPQITVSLKQSKTDPFRRGQSITLQATSTSTCPVRAMNLFARESTEKSGPVYCGGRFNPLSREQLTQQLRNLSKYAITSKMLVTNTASMPVTVSELVLPPLLLHQVSLLG